MRIYWVCINFFNFADKIEGFENSIDPDEKTRNESLIRLYTFFFYLYTFRHFVLDFCLRDISFSR